MSGMSNYLDVLVKNGFNPDKLTDDQRLYLDLAMTRPKTPDELWNYVALFFGVRLPRKKICEGCCAPFDAFANSYFADDPVSIWLASRGSGKSISLALLGMVTQVTLGCNINILGGSLEQSERILAYIRVTHHSVVVCFGTLSMLLGTLLTRVRRTRRLLNCITGVS